MAADFFCFGIDQENEKLHNPFSLHFRFRRVNMKSIMRFGTFVPIGKKADYEKNIGFDFGGGTADWFDADECICKEK